jgi:hypothetical protein
MFKKKRDITATDVKKAKEILERENRINDIIDDHKNEVTCEVCKCKLDKDDAFRKVSMEKTLRGSWTYNGSMFGWAPTRYIPIESSGDQGNYEIQETFYCQKCKPVKKVTKKKTKKKLKK